MYLHVRINNNKCKKYLTTKIANVYQQIESIGSIMVNLLNFLLLGWSATRCDDSSCSLVILRMADLADANDDLFGRFPFGRFKLLAGSADAERSLGVSKEIDDGI